MTRLATLRLIAALPLLGALTFAVGCSEETNAVNLPPTPNGGAGGAAGQGGTATGTGTGTGTTSTSTGTGATGGGGGVAGGGVTGGGGSGGETPTGGSGGATPTGGSGGATPTGGSGGATPTGGSGGATPTGGSGGATPTGGSGGAGNSATGGSGGSGGAPECFGPGDCDDQKGCTNDDCVQGVCVNVPNDGMCSNNTFCDGVELCDPADPNANAVSGCVAGVDPCDDGKECTVDSCNETDHCANATDDSLCDDSQYCNGVETCVPTNGNANPLTGCLAGTAIACAPDTLDCTTATCNEVLDQCTQVPSDAFCQNANYCDGVEHCDANQPGPGTGCVDGADPVCNDGIGCTDDSCNEQTDDCDFIEADVHCDDTLYCTGAEWCDPADGNADPTSGCVQGALPNCSDGKTCTTDICDTTPGVDECTHTPIANFCDDGLYCTGTEVCNPSAGNANATTGCVPGTAVVCPDENPSIACTIDECSNQLMDCVHTPDNDLCPGQFCVPAAGGCADGAPCTTDGECDDDNDCNGIEYCDTFCRAGTPKDCDDGAVCTADSCNSVTGDCEYSYFNNFCNDGFACTGVEVCDPLHASADPVTGCTNPPNVVCADEFSCTLDSCQEPGGTCEFTPQNSVCANDLYCDGAEICAPSDPNANATTGCVAGTPPTCADSVACTLDTCDEVSQQCRHVPDDSLCWDPGHTCTPGGMPQPTCDAQQGCGNFCLPAECGNSTLLCGNCIDDDGDCYADAGGDDMCFGPCDNTEDSLYPDMHQPLNCGADCYYDSDSGSGNDTCLWDYGCDPNSIAPDYHPTGNKTCDYTKRDVAQCDAWAATDPNGQTDQCLGINQPPGTWSCMDVAPNGCDCFGCCDIPLPSDPNTVVTVWLGSNGDKGYGNNTDCELTDAALQDETRCRPCYRVPSCLNTCDHCEICIGKPELPPDCLCQVCDPGVQLCGPPCGTPCPDGYFCNTGCCALNPA